MTCILAKATRAEVLICVGVACTMGEGSLVLTSEVIPVVFSPLIGSSQPSKPGTTPETYSDL